MSSPQLISFTPEGYKDVQQEYDRLMASRPEAVEQLRKAREMGDLSENGYYKAARARLSQVDARLRHLKKLLLLGRIIKKTSSTHIQIGSIVTLQSSDKTVTYTIVGGYESDPSKGKISHISPLGRSLIGKSAQDKVIVQTPSGTAHYFIQSVV